MCGIIGFISNDNFLQEKDISWIDTLITTIPSTDNYSDFACLNNWYEQLHHNFNQLVSFNLYINTVKNKQTEEKINTLLHFIENNIHYFDEQKSKGKGNDAIDRIHEKAKDLYWQIKYDTLALYSSVTETVSHCSSSNTAQHFTAWSIEQVLRNLERLEVRGRDSAGITIQCMLPSSSVLTDILAPELITELRSRTTVSDASVTFAFKENYKKYHIATFTYKVANLVGKLGDNCKNLKEIIQRDQLLWEFARHITKISIVSHTRWASNGAITVRNCHPVYINTPALSAESAHACNHAHFVLNGDVDNYPDLAVKIHQSHGYYIQPLDTDASILPAVYEFETNSAESAKNRFNTTMNRCNGSLAVAMLNPCYPDELHLGLKGSGQSLFVTPIIDGVMVSSEMYGLASLSRSAFPLIASDDEGIQVKLSTAGVTSHIEAFGMKSNSPKEVYYKSIDIYSRDIYLGNYDCYLEKELHDAPLSIEKTIRSKYIKEAEKILFSKETYGTLLSRFIDDQKPPVNRIVAIGQGTASIAAMGIAFLVEKALRKTGIMVTWAKSSEMFQYNHEESLENMLIIAISQSGTTTDTNRTVDVLRKKGAWIHAIVNRRNSPLVDKSDSYNFTSDGRDIEISVASTKAFYSQITAGKLLALVLAQHFQSIDEHTLYKEINELEKLKDKVNTVLGAKESIKAIAAQYAPISKNWSIVGNGWNKIAAEEIRIKLSELCYKSIPCDITEDKKHIDLSTEPLTIVIANELIEDIVRDTVKEVYVFKSHNGKPIVICEENEHRFTEVAEKVITVPSIGGNLGFVLATVVGHLFGFYAAKAIDATAEELKKIRQFFISCIENPHPVPPASLTETIDHLVNLIATEKLNSSTRTSLVAQLARTLIQIERTRSEPAVKTDMLKNILDILNSVILENIRPIDTIRHQAKTITVGISRPELELSVLVQDLLASLSVDIKQIKQKDLQYLSHISSTIERIDGGILYDVRLPFNDMPLIKVNKKFGESLHADSRFNEFKTVFGLKSKIFKLQHYLWSNGHQGDENLLFIPVWDTDKSFISNILMLNIGFVSDASIELKYDIIKRLRERYEELVAIIEENVIFDEQKKITHVINTLIDSFSFREIIVIPFSTLVSRILALVDKK